MTDDPLEEHPDSVNGGRGADESEPTEAELFPVGSLAGDDVTAQTLVRRGLPTSVTVSLAMAEVPTKSGLVHPDRSGRVLVSYVPGKVEHVPERDDDGKVVAWKLRQHLRPTFVADANDETNVARNAFAALLATDAPAAGALLSELRQLAEAEIGAPA